MPATSICFTWPTASPSRKIELDHDRRRLEVQTAPEAHAGGRADRKIRHADLELERADSQPMSAAAICGKEEMKDRRPEARDADRAGAGSTRASDRRLGAPDPARRRKRQRRHEQEHRQVAQDEGDRFGHHGLLTARWLGQRRAARYHIERRRANAKGLNSRPISLSGRLDAHENRRAQDLRRRQSAARLRRPLLPLPQAQDRLRDRGRRRSLCGELRAEGDRGDDRGRVRASRRGRRSVPHRGACGATSTAAAIPAGPTFR